MYVAVSEECRGFSVFEVSEDGRFIRRWKADWYEESKYGCAMDVTADSDGTLYIPSFDAGLSVWRFSEEEGFTRLGSVMTPGWANASSKIGNFLFVADSLEGLTVLDVSDPHHPKVISNLRVGGFAFDLKFSNGRLYLLDDWGFSIIDVSTPEKPKLIGRFIAEGRVTGFDVVGDTVYLSAYRAGLFAVDASETENPKVIGYMEKYFPGSLFFRSGYVYLSSSLGDPWIVDVKEGDPKRIKKWKFFKKALQTPDFVLLIDSSLSTWDFSDPLEPVPLDEIEADLPTGIDVF